MNPGSSSSALVSSLPNAGRTIDHQHAIQLMLVEMRDRARHAEQVLHELTVEIARIDKEADDWRAMMQRQDSLDKEAEKDPLTAFLNGIAVVHRSAVVGASVGKDMTNAAQRFSENEVRIRDMKHSEEMLTGEIERDRWDKMRLLKMIDIFMMGRSAPTAGETMTFAKFGSAKSESLMRVIRALPAQNVALLDRQGVFKCILGVMTAASQQQKRYGFVDLERVASHGVRYTGSSLGLSVIHDEMTEDDFFRL